MTDVAISIKNLSKCYRIYKNPRDRLKEVLTLGRRKYHQEFWALKDVTLDVKKGETLGIIGRNGSGKSTLLQILCRTVTPTEGTVEVNGRVSALLELGSGFNPEFTGRENVYMNASILGLSKEEIDDKYESIVDFAEIVDFIDRPVKTYSSGMYVRLAFAVAVNVEPDILVVDEALAVGDEWFQRKCYSRISAIRDHDASVLFVSHSADTILALADKAILVDLGEVIMTGEPNLVTSHYHKMMAAPASGRIALRNEVQRLGDRATQVTPASGEHPTDVRISGRLTCDPFFDPKLAAGTGLSYTSRGARIHSAEITDVKGHRVNCLLGRKVYHYSYLVELYEPAVALQFGMLIKSKEGIQLGGYLTPRALSPNPAVAPGGTFRVVFRFHCLLQPGVYFMNAGVICNDGTPLMFLHRYVDVLAFRVLPREGDNGTYMVDFMIEPDLEVVVNNSDPNLSYSSSCTDTCRTG